jgi:hypothetical protein
LRRCGPIADATALPAIDFDVDRGRGADADAQRALPNSLDLSTKSHQN